MLAQMSRAELDRLFVYRRLSDDEVAAYERDGFLLVGRTLTDDGVEEMRRQCMEVWTARKGPFDPTKPWTSNQLLPNPHHDSELARRFYFDGPGVDFAEQLVSPNLKGAWSQLTFKMRGNTIPVTLHQDNSFGELDPYNALTVLTALDDADLDTGCLWIVPGSHRRGQIKAGMRPEEQGLPDLGVDDAGAIPVPMKAGESVAFHAWTLHRSGGNTSPDRDRRILFLRYTDADTVEVGSGRTPLLGRLLRGETSYPEVRAYESYLD